MYLSQLTHQSNHGVFVKSADFRENLPSMIFLQINLLNKLNCLL